MIIIIIIRLWNPIYFAKYYQTTIAPLNKRVTKKCCPSLFFHSKSMNPVLVCLIKIVRPNRFGIYWLISSWTEDPFAWSLRNHGPQLSSPTEYHLRFCRANSTIGSQNVDLGVVQPYDSSIHMIMERKHKSLTNNDCHIALYWSSLWFHMILESKLNHRPQFSSSTG